MSLSVPVRERRAGRLPDGVVVTPLVAHGDDRGRFIEIFRASWPTGIEPLQWNIVSSVAGVLRGVHVHRRHGDYLTVASGRLTLGLAICEAGLRRMSAASSSTPRSRPRSRSRPALPTASSSRSRPSTCTP